MLALNGGIRLWHVSDSTDMRYGKYRLLRIVQSKGRDPYNGDAYVFLSKNRRTLKILRYDHDKVVLYDISYKRGYRFMRPVYKNGELWHQLDFKYLVALLNCPSVKELKI
ncbi:IS66 family insertion sequence element accessory protein TnpB [Parabacteroides sp.]